MCHLVFDIPLPESQRRLFSYMTTSCPRQKWPIPVGLLNLLPPISPDKRKRRREMKKNQREGKTIRVMPRTYSAISPPTSAPGYTSTSTSPSFPVTGLSGVSFSGGADALHSLCGGEGGLHPLATRRASPFTGHTLAWERRGPEQFLHLATTCAHAWPRLTWRPSTGHRWSDIWWSSPHRTHLGVATGHWGAMWPHA